MKTDVRPPLPCNSRIKGRALIVVAAVFDDHGQLLGRKLFDGKDIGSTVGEQDGLHLSWMEQHVTHTHADGGIAANGQLLAGIVVDHDTLLFSQAHRSFS